MKKAFLSLLVITIMVTSCKKEGRGSDDFAMSQSSGSLSGSSSGSGSGNIPASSVPASVMAAFKAKFPTATRIEWKRLSNGNYKVEFNLGTVRWEAIYTPTGTLVKLERAS